MTKDVLNRLPENILRAVNQYKKQYTQLSDPRLKGATHARMAGYVNGLRDAGAITERERQIIYIYMTV